MIYIIHCNSCVYYMLSAAQGFGQIAYRYRDRWYLNKWVYNNEGERRRDDFWGKLLASV